MTATPTATTAAAIRVYDNILSPPNKSVDEDSSPQGRCEPPVELMGTGKLRQGEDSEGQDGSNAVADPTAEALAPDRYWS